MIGSEIYRRSTYGEWHPLKVPRVSTVIDLTRALDWVGPGQYLQSPRAKPDALTLWHDPVYLDVLQRAERAGRVSEGERKRHNIGTHANPVFAEIWRRPATAAGGALLSAELLRKPGIVFHPAGGTHHGMPDHANGFCYLNDPVLAILSLRRNGIGRIAYVDIDAHHPDGVEHAFADDPDVLMISIHEERRWPFTGALADEGRGQVFNLPVPRGFNDDEMALARDALILPAIQAFRPEALVLQCGADAVEEDPLARLSLSNNAHWAIVGALKDMAPRVLVTGGGGYNPWSVGRLWTGVWAMLNSHPVPDRLPASAEGVLRGLEWKGNRRAASAPDTWFTTLRDAPRHGPIRDDVQQRIAHLARRLAVWA